MTDLWQIGRLDSVKLVQRRVVSEEILAGTAIPGDGAEGGGWGGGGGEERLYQTLLWQLDVIGRHKDRE